MHPFYSSVDCIGVAVCDVPGQIGMLPAAIMSVGREDKVLWTSG